MMRRREYLLGSFGAGIAALGGACTAAPMDNVLSVVKEAGKSEKMAGTIAVIVDEQGTQMASHGSSGVRGLPMDANAVFEIMSITKVLTALLLADMVARGEVAFDEPLAKYLLPSEKPLEHDKPITLLDLASYRSGLPNMPGNLPPDWYMRQSPLAHYPEAKVFEFLSGYAPKYEPGAHYEYANLGFGLLGIALARRAGKRYEDLLVERICNPLDLDHTRITLTSDMRRHLVQGHDVNLKPVSLMDIPAMPAMGCVRSTAKDLTVFLKACMGVAPSRFGTPFARMLQTRNATPVAGTDAGLGWFISRNGTEEIAWKSGLSEGCSTFIGFSIQKHRGVVLLSNFLGRSGDIGTINAGLKMISPEFPETDFLPLYLP